MRKVIFIVFIALFNFMFSTCTSEQTTWSPAQADLLFMSNHDGNGETILSRPAAGNG